MGKWRALFLLVLIFGLVGDVSAVARRKKVRKPRAPTSKKELTCGQNSKKGVGPYHLFRDRHALEKQNAAVDYWNLERVENEKDLQLLITGRRLVGVPYFHPFYYIDKRLDHRTYFIRPFTLDCIEELTRDFYFDNSQKKSLIGGLIRWRSYQEDLVKRLPKGQAASEKNGYWCQSSHLSGATFDLSTNGLKEREVCWLLEYLKSKQANEEISVIWEEQNRVLHIMVFPFQVVH